jgi:broad specificity phosphatase PhoE
MQTIVLIRHGYLLSWDQRLKVRGTEPHLRLDAALAASGQTQARHAATRVAADGGATVVLSSPFRSCLETADLIAAACATTVTADWRLGEVLLSQVVGSPFSPTSAMDPAWAERRVGAGKPSHPESDRTIQQRCTAVVADLKARKPFAQRVVVVSHAIILNELAKLMTGRAVACDWHPAALTTLVRRLPVDRTWRMTGALADIAHLGADDRTEPVEQIEVRYHPQDSRS